VNVKYAGTQQHPTAITIDVALDINVTMSRKTNIAMITALGFTPSFFYMKEKLGLLSNFVS
jgi:hypothetical protein